MAGDSLPIKDPDNERPVAESWRDTFRTIVARVVDGDDALRGIPGVQPLSPEVGADVLRDRIANYDDVTLTELPDATSETSVAMWGGSDYWDVLIDLHTSKKVAVIWSSVLGSPRTSSGYSFEVHGHFRLFLNRSAVLSIAATRSALSRARKASSM